MNPEKPKLRGISDILNSSSKMKGIGDVVSKITETLKIPKCGACAARQKKLNEMFPFDKSKKS